MGIKYRRSWNNINILKNEILAVIQVTDTDGVFINDDCILVDESLGAELAYYPESIHVSNQQNANNIKKRNKFKASNLKVMYSTMKVQKNLDYYLLYFSCNLDHVLHNDHNLNEKEKVPKAKEFDKKFRDSPNDFMEFFKSEEFAVKGTLSESWEFIQEGNNSLERHSNFHLVFDILDILIKK